MEVAIAGSGNRKLFGVRKYNRKITCFFKVLINDSHQLFARALKRKKIEYCQGVMSVFYARISFGNFVR